jgi:hypothetical protein
MLEIIVTYSTVRSRALPNLSSQLCTLLSRFGLNPCSCTLIRRLFTHHCARVSAFALIIWLQASPFFFLLFITLLSSEDHWTRYPLRENY